MKLCAEYSIQYQEYSIEYDIQYLIVSEFQSLCKKYYKKSLQGVTELTEILGEIFRDIIWRS